MYLTGSQKALHEMVLPIDLGDAATHDPFVALTVAACATKRIMLGTGICLIVQRDPTLLAKEIASLDRVADELFLASEPDGMLKRWQIHGTPFKQR